MKTLFLFAMIGPFVGWVSAQLGQSCSTARIHPRQVSGLLVITYPSATSSTNPPASITSTVYTSLLTSTPATSSTCPVTVTSTIYPSGYSQSTTQSTTTASSSSRSSSSVSSSSSSVNPYCTNIPDPNPKCPDSSGETATTLNQYYRVICGGYYGASMLLTNTSHPSPYSLTSCISECINFNTAGYGTSMGTGNCSMVVLEPPSSGAGRAGYNCFSFGGLISEDFAAANGLEWASGILLSPWQASQALCAPGPDM